MDVLKIPTKDDIGMNMVQRKHGLEGFAIAIKIMQEIVWNGGSYKWNETTINFMAQENGVSLNFIREVSHCCVKAGLLDLSDDVLTFGKESGKIGKFNERK